MNNPNPYQPNNQAPYPNQIQPPPNNNEGDATGGVIPYKNPKALISYYLGILSGLPIIGFPLGVIAFILGIMGLRDRNRNPAIKGSIHAGIGIGCGGFFAVFWGIILIVIVVGVSGGFNNRR